MIDNLISGSPGKVDYSYDTCLLGLPPATSPTSHLSLVSQIAVVGVSAHPFLSSGVLHHPLVLSRSNWPYADLGIGVVGAQLFWLHFFGDVEVGSRVPSGCCTRLTTDIPPQTCRLQGPEAGTPFFRSSPPCKGSLSRSQCRGSRSIPPSSQRQEDSSP